MNPSVVVNESGDIFPVGNDLGDDQHIAVPKVENKEYASLIVMLMEVTSDVEAFENETKSCMKMKLETCALFKGQSPVICPHCGRSLQPGCSPVWFIASVLHPF